MKLFKAEENEVGMTSNLQKNSIVCESLPFFIRPHRREAADLWRKSDSSEELKGSSSGAASNQSDWPLSPLMASEADVSDAAAASGPQPPTSIVVIPSVSRNVVPGDPRNGGHQRH